MTSRHLLFLLARRLYSLRPPLPAVLIMGHMRSGSTLLLHILLTNRRLIGCGERNAAYSSHLDLDKLEITARIAQRAPFRRVRYAVDQINHDQLTPSRDFLKDERVLLIFLIRDPPSTIHSILELTRTFYGGAWTVEKTIDYYCRRLQTLTDHAVGLAGKQKVMALSYESLVDDTSTVLRGLQTFLGLDAELREQYGIQRFTGKRGDPSEKIRAGRIVRRRLEPRTRIPPDGLERATKAYRAYRNAIDSFIAVGRSGEVGDRAAG